MVSNVVDLIERTAREALGHAQLRPGQEEAIAAVLEGRDTLVVMPTGAGKSAIYQAAGAMLPGLTVVISPLIALQQDQVAALAAADAGRAALLNSTLTRGEREAVLEDIAAGEIRFLFLAPEQLANEETLARLQASRPSLVVIDEAHCISAWGHDFRPEYLRLGAVIPVLGRPRILGLTATASPPVRDEIVQRLEMDDPLVIVQGFDRPNIHLTVEGYGDGDAKRAALLERVMAAPKPGIVYAATRKHTEEVADALCAQGVRALAYHAGMSAGDREQAQDAFMRDEADVMVATTAFGMGVDKPNVRFVYHLEISSSIDAYYQEIGRAGRDGEAAEAVLFYHPDDLNLQRFFAGSGQVDAEQIALVGTAVGAAATPLTIAAVSDEVDISQAKVSAAIQALADAGVLEILPTGEVRSLESGAALDVAEEAAAAQANRRAFERSRLEMMRGYADMQECRRAYLLNYFGECVDGPCQHCDNCDEGLVTTKADGDLPFPLQSLVEHVEWGAGRVMRYAGETMVVLFNTVGYRTLALDLVMAKALLTAVAA